MNTAKGIMERLQCQASDGVLGVQDTRVDALDGVVGVRSSLDNRCCG